MSLSENLKKGIEKFSNKNWYYLLLPLLIVGGLNSSNFNKPSSTNIANKISSGIKEYQKGEINNINSQKSEIEDKLVLKTIAEVSEELLNFYENIKDPSIKNTFNKEKVKKLKKQLNNISGIDIKKELVEIGENPEKFMKNLERKYNEEFGVLILHKNFIKSKIEEYKKTNDPEKRKEILEKIKFSFNILRRATGDYFGDKYDHNYSILPEEVKKIIKTTGEASKIIREVANKATQITLKEKNEENITLEM